MKVRDGRIDMQREQDAFKAGYKWGNDAMSKTSVAKVTRSKPFRGMMTMLFACMGFLAFLSLVTVAIHFIML